jgi:thioredoxin reductase (NADPH)
MRSASVLIIGAGPAGMAVALQLKRYGIDSVLFEKNKIGGLLHNANLVENYPGFPGGIPGPELVALFEQQTSATGVNVTREEVKTLEFAGGNFHLQTQSEAYESRIAVLASGTRPRRLTGFDLSEQVLPRVYYEVAPLLHLQGKQIVIVGGGDAAFDYALNLGKHNEVTILNRSQSAKCLPLLWERVMTKRTIHYRADAQVLQVSEGSGGGLSIDYTLDERTHNLPADYLVGAVGREACLDFLTQELERQAGELQSLGVLYFVGDVKNQHYRQTAIAVGDGILAAMKIYEVVRT